MKRLLFAPLFISIIFFACSKGSSTPAAAVNYIIASVDGKPDTFNVITAAKIVTTPGAYQLLLTAAANNTSSADVMTLRIDGHIPIATGTIVETINTGANASYIPWLIYTLNDPWAVYEQTVNGSIPVTISITSLTSTNVQGTFSIPLFRLNGTGPEDKIITNGSFNVNFK